MRPRAADCKVGTKHTGYVVKTRKANQHSNRRVKYWARVTLKRPKKSVQKRTTTQKSKKKHRFTKPRLRGGDNHLFLHKVLKMLADKKSPLMKMYKNSCSVATYNELLLVSEKIADILASESDQEEAHARIRNELFDQYTFYHGMAVTDVFYRPSLNAYAIMLACFNVANDHDPTNTTQTGVKATGRISGVEHTVTIYVGPNDKIWQSIQEVWPVYVSTVAYNGKTVVDAYSTSRKFEMLKFDGNSIPVLTVKSMAE